VTTNYTPQDIALDVIAIALILAPEPFTTPIGISLLCRKRGGKQQESSKPLHNYPEYVYRVDTIHGREITWEARTIMPGQLQLQELNRPTIKIKPREEFIIGRKTTGQSPGQSASQKLPPGIKVHHTLINPPREIRPSEPAFIPGETVHHALRQLPQVAPVFKKSSHEVKIHHTIENSPGYIRARSGGIDQQPQPAIVHHSLRNSPGAQMSNPIKIEKPPPVILEHHTIDTNPPIRRKGPVIPPPPPSVKGGITGRNPGSGTRR